MKRICKGYLKDYQRAGIDRIKDLKGRVILADEPGLGKTIQTLAYLYEAQRFPALIVCPASLKLNWQQEIKKWLDLDDVYICEGTNNIVAKCNIAARHKIIIINYDILINWVYELYYNAGIRAYVFDEAHLIKDNKEVYNRHPKMKYGILCTGANDRVSATDFLMRHACYASKIFITGTPVVNGVADMANFLYWIEPFLLDGYKEFLKRYTNEEYNHRLKKIEYLGGNNLIELNDLLKYNFMIRRVKKSELPDLPNKNRIFIPVECEFYAKLGRRIPINELQKERVARTEYILPTVISWIKDFLESDKKLVVFCNFTATVDALKNEFKEQCVVFDGRCSTEQKDNAVKEFQSNPYKKVFIGNLQAAGVGITLTAADTVLTVDFAHTVKDHYQAEDRVCRIGQKSNNVTAYYIYVPNSVDEQMVDNLNEKAVVAKGAVDGQEVLEADLFIRDSFKRQYTDEEKKNLRKEYIINELKDFGLMMLLAVIAGLTFNLFFSILDFYKDKDEC